MTNDEILQWAALMNFAYMSISSTCVIGSLLTVDWLSFWSSANNWLLRDQLRPAECFSIARLGGNSHVNKVPLFGKVVSAGNVVCRCSPRTSERPWSPRSTDSKPGFSANWLRNVEA